MRKCSAPCSFNPRSYKRSDAVRRGLLPGLQIFQSTLLQEERRMRLFGISLLRIFQSTLLQEERRGWNVLCFSADPFNPRSYKRSDNHIRQSLYPSFCFQSTLLQEERPFLFHIFSPVLVFQSTLLQEERPFSFFVNFATVFLSIHAPTRGATNFDLSSVFLPDLSIHAPTRGATLHW